MTGISGRRSQVRARANTILEKAGGSLVVWRGKNAGWTDETETKIAEGKAGEKEKEKEKPASAAAAAGAPASDILSRTAIKLVVK